VGHPPPVVSQGLGSLPKKREFHLDKIMYLGCRTYLQAMVALALIMVVYGSITPKSIRDACVIASLASFLRVILAVISGDFSTKTVAIDYSPQAMFSRDEISQLEMEQEIERQLNAGLSGTDSMKQEISYRPHSSDDGFNLNLAQCDECNAYTHHYNGTEWARATCAIWTSSHGKQDWD
jgi:hypothetical protein